MLPALTICIHYLGRLWGESILTNKSVLVQHSILYFRNRCGIEKTCQNRVCLYGIRERNIPLQRAVFHFNVSCLCANVCMYACMYAYIHIFIHSLVFSLQSRAWQEPEVSHVIGMALAHCIQGNFLGVVCHCFPPPLDVPNLVARCLRPQRRERS